MNPRPLPRSAARNLSPWRLLGWLFLATVLAVNLIPLWFALRTALLPSGSLYEHSAELGLTQLTLDNFLRVLGLRTHSADEWLGGAQILLAPALLNSLLFTTIIVVCQTLSSALAAYAFARLRFAGRDLLFALLVGTMMLPPVVTYIPNFMLIRDLGWLNSMAGMVAPFCLISGFSVFFLRQFFISIPRDLEEAALLDGASRLYIFFRLVLPLSLTPLATIALLTGISAWNEFFWPYLVARDDAHQVLPVALQSFKTQTAHGLPDWTGLMAAVTISTLPTLCLLIAFGRQVVESVQHTGSK